MTISHPQISIYREIFKVFEWIGNLEFGIWRAVGPNLHQPWWGPNWGNEKGRKG